MAARLFGGSGAHKGRPYRRVDAASTGGKGWREPRRGLYRGGRRIGRRFVRVQRVSHQHTDPPSPDVQTPRAVFAVDRAIGDLRRGGVVVLSDGIGASAVLSTEYATPTRLARLAALPGGPVRLVVTTQRAQALGYPAGSGPVVALALPVPLDAARIHDLSDPTAPASDLSAWIHGSSPAVAHARDIGAVSLAKFAGLLPAVLTAPLDTAATGAAAWARRNDMMLVELADIRHYGDAGATALTQVGAARVPLAGAEETTIVAFRPGDGGTEHLAIVIGDPEDAAPALVRLHSQCFTGDLIGSMRCDCGDQLQGAIRHIAGTGAGAILYLAQEGRGIGLVNKLRAYELQDRGYDTFDANEMLGFDSDERHYLVAAEMLRQLGYGPVRLLTNNPAKIAGLRRCGVDVVERVPHSFPANRHNERYLATKATRGGHLIRR